MGDRNNPIKFGPEWLRNLSREPSAGGSGTNNHNPPPGGPGSTSGSQSQDTGAIDPSPGNMTNTGMATGSNYGMSAAGSVGATAGSSVASSVSSGGGSSSSGPSVPRPSTGATSRNKTSNVSKVLLAKLRYGREEMLALYDRSSESPEELKHFDLLYQPRGKPPFALHNALEEEARENVRGGPAAGAMPTVERYSLTRGGGAGRGGCVNEVRGRPRMPFVRQTSLGRGGTSWHVNNTTRMPNYNTGPEEDATLRPWNNNNSNGVTPANRTTGESPEWTNTKMFRRRQNNTNWRQTHYRDENDEWRPQENLRGRPQTDKWDREWGERPNQDRQSWNANRRTWVGNETQNNDDNLPEWAVDNAEAGAGTFDSSGAFHGYSNDDSNLPKSQETSFPLARSHTHGSFVRTKTTEDTADEWWASEKAKKLSAKKIDTGDMFMQGNMFGSAEGGTSNSKPSSGRDARDDDLLDEIDKAKEETDPPESHDNIEPNNEDVKQNNMYPNQYQDNKQFETLMRSDLNLDDSTEEMNNFHSVMMTSNNSLRQKHQNLVTGGAMNLPAARRPRNTGLLQIIQNDNENHDQADEKLVEKILDMTLEDNKLQTSMMSQMHSSGMNPGMPNPMGNPNLQLQMGSNQVLSGHGLSMKAAQNLQMSGFPPSLQHMQNVGLSNPMNPPIQNVGIHNSALNSSLGLPLGPANSGLVMPMPGVPPPVIPNTGMQARLAFQSGAGMPMIPGNNVGNASVFMPSNNTAPNDMQMPNPSSQNNLFPMHPLQHSGSQGPFGSMFSQPPPPINPDTNLADLWYYEDPEKIIQGPFTSKEMYSWYRAGFFSPSLMVRRACETHLRPLGAYGPVVPFLQLDMPPPFPLTQPFDRRRQQGIGLDDTLWSQPPPASDLIWMQQMNPRNESRINNLPMFFWDSQANSTMPTNSMLPEEIAKEMKTEDQILAQLRASQKLPSPPNVSFMNDTASTSTANISTIINKPDDSYKTKVSATPNLEELQKLIQPEKLTPPMAVSVPEPDPVPEAEPEKPEQIEPTEVKETPPKVEPLPEVPVPTESPPVVVPKQQQPQTKASETKTPKQNKSEAEKTAKKENINAKGKSKKAKEEKKDTEIPEAKVKEDEVPVKPEKRSVESSPIKNKKEEKQNKKEQEKEKKELTKDGFTMVKTGDKVTNKENKKKVVEEAKALAAAAEEAERKKKEDEKIAIEEEKKRKIAEAIKKAQEQQQQRAESARAKAPWSAGALAAPAGRDGPGLTLAEIQRLEREKKLEQMREQQHMMHIIAQQQAAALAREQVIEMQSGLGWSKKKAPNHVSVSGQSLAEIQAETRKAAAAAAATAAAAAAQALDESPFTVDHAASWAGAHNGGFWETQLSLPSKADKASDGGKGSDNGKAKKKAANANKETTPTVEFDAWCTSILSSWSSKIDVPTFVGFLKDIESPYEVKDYVKCYLGETKDSSDFARQFLERRSKLLRVGMVTPSDDLCSPAMAINPRNTSLGDYQEVKGKGKKTKKNKMLKVDARILGFSVTAAEDRINVGDIDTV